MKLKYKELITIQSQYSHISVKKFTHIITWYWQHSRKTGRLNNNANSLYQKKASFLVTISVNLLLSTGTTSCTRKIIGARVSTQVALYIKSLTILHGNNNIPSGHLPSSHTKPFESYHIVCEPSGLVRDDEAEISAVKRARRIIPLILAC